MDSGFYMPAAAVFGAAMCAALHFALGYAGFRSLGWHGLSAITDGTSDIVPHRSADSIMRGRVMVGLHLGITVTVITASLIVTGA
ncbi:hypothetical protein [uncultured Corynebacterium sp.]|uniref:hypothetical protein n=1 Tax=uncultured Corynebacterium sp. TaxID=159447 RepID=UPI0025D88690|nr:hypothetical protein [uncultured Corynebacterium sp.]